MRCSPRRQRPATRRAPRHERPAQAPEPGGRSDERDFFLPDFCEARAVLAIVLIAALTGLVLALARTIRRRALLDRSGAHCPPSCCGPACCPPPCCAGRGRGSRGSRLRAAIAMALGCCWPAPSRCSPMRVPARPVLDDPVRRAIDDPARVALARSCCRTLCIGLAHRRLMLRYFYVAHMAPHVELEARARVHALQARIRPHFLFNSMNTIASLTRTRPGAGRGGHRGPRRPVPRQPGRRALADHVCGRARGRADLPAHRAAAARRPPAGALGH